MLLTALLLLTSCERPAVQVVPARQGTVESTATSIEAGVVKARRDSSLSPPVSGRIVEILKKQGDHVKSGEALLRLENDLERIAVAEAELDLKRLQSLGTSGVAAEEALDRARFALERARVNYERTFVRALFPGILVDLNARLGEMSYGTLPLNLVMGGKGGGGEKPLARVVDDSELYVEADIDEADAGRLKVNQPARVTVEALGGKVFTGSLSRVSQAVSTTEGQSRTVRVEIDLSAGSPDPSGTGSLLVGMSADVEVIVERMENVVYVPTLVILEGESEKSVFVVEEGRLHRRQVEVGAANWENTEARRGLQAGELVVVPTDRRLLVDGLEVRAERRAEASRP